MVVRLNNGRVKWESRFNFLLYRGAVFYPVLVGIPEIVIADVR